MTTEELARALGMKCASIRGRLSRFKHFYGVTPETVERGRHKWPADAVERVQAARAANQAQIMRKQRAGMSVAMGRARGIG